MSHNYESQSSADPSGGLSKIGFYCLISCRAKIDIRLRHRFKIGVKLERSIGVKVHSKSKISPFKVNDIFSLFHYPLCHSNNQEINRKQKILLQFLPSGNVSSHDVTMTSLRHHYDVIMYITLISN